MTAEELSQSAASDLQPPADLSATEKTLWLARAGRWGEAHDACQDLPDPAGSWIHAYLHREEGDLGNAGYWYARAGRAAPPPSQTIAAEWLEIASALCD